MNDQGSGASPFELEIDKRRGRLTDRRNVAGRASSSGRLKVGVVDVMNTKSSVGILSRSQ